MNVQKFLETNPVIKQGWEIATSETAKNAAINVAICAVSGALIIGGAVALSYLIPKFFTYNLNAYKFGLYNGARDYSLLKFTSSSQLVKTTVAVIAASSAIGIGIFGIKRAAKNITDILKQNSSEKAKAFLAQVEKYGMMIELAMTVLMLVGGISVLAAATQHLRSLGFSGFEYMVKRYQWKTIYAIAANPTHMKLVISGLTIGGSLSTLGLLNSIEMGVNSITARQAAPPRRVANFDWMGQEVL